jgi:Glycosyl hydrolase family 36 C-terminal domain
LLLLVYRIDPQTQRHAPVVKLPMLDTAKRYRIENGGECDGAWLAAHGLVVPPMQAECCHMVRLTAL